MPNFKLGTSVRAEINKQMQALTSNRVAHACANFPLTTAEIQAAVMKPHHLKTLRELTAEGMHVTSQDSRPSIYLTPEYLPGLAREVGICLWLPEDIYVPRRTPGYHNQSTWNTATPTFLRLDAGELDDDQRAALATWGNRAIRDCRLKKLADHTVAAILERCETVAHVMAWAPVIGTLVTDQFWLKRFRNPPQKLKHYMPHETLRARFAKLLEASEVVITGGQLLPEFKYDAKIVRAFIASYKPLESDPPNT